MALLSSIITSISASTIFTAPLTQSLLATLGLSGATVGGQILALSALFLFATIALTGMGVALYFAWKKSSVPHPKTSKMPQNTDPTKTTKAAPSNTREDGISKDTKPQSPSLKTATELPSASGEKPPQAQTTYSTQPPVFYGSNEEKPAPAPAIANANIRRDLDLDKPPLTTILGNNETWQSLRSKAALHPFLNQTTRDEINATFNYDAPNIFQMLRYIPQVHSLDSAEKLCLSEIGDNACVWGIDTNNVFFISYKIAPDSEHPEKLWWITARAIPKLLENQEVQITWTLKIESLYEMSTEFYPTLTQDEISGLVQDLQTVGGQAYAPAKTPSMQKGEGEETTAERVTP